MVGPFVALSFLILILHVVLLVRRRPNLWSSLACSQACLLLAAGHWVMRENAELKEFRLSGPGAYDPTVWAEVQAFKIYPVAIILGVGALILIEGVIRAIVLRNREDD